MEESDLLPYPAKEQQHQQKQQTTEQKMKRTLIGGLLLALVILIAVILIVVVAISSAGSETKLGTSNDSKARLGSITRSETRPSSGNLEHMARPWLDGDYKCGKINWAIVRVDGDLQVLQYGNHHYYHHDPYYNHHHHQHHLADAHPAQVP